MQLTRIVIGTLACSFALCASVVYLPVAGTVNGSIYVPTGGGAPTYSVDGLVSGLVYEFPASTLTGPANLSGADPYPASILTLTSSDLTQSALVFFNFGLSFFSGTTWTVLETTIPVGSLTDPALLGLGGVGYAQFDLTGSVDVGTGTVFAYSLTSITIPDPAAPGTAPEPAAIGLAGVGLAALIAVQRRQRART